MSSTNDIITDRKKLIDLKNQLIEINNKLKKAPESVYQAPGAQGQDNSARVLNIQKKDIEKQIRQIENKLKTTVAPTGVSDGTIKDTTQPNPIDKSYTLNPDGQVTMNVPIYLGGGMDSLEPTTPKTTSGYLLGNTLTRLPNNFYDAKDYGTISPMFQSPSAFRDQIYSQYINKPQDVIGLKEKIKDLVPDLLSGDPMDGEVSPAFLDAMVTLAARISERNYYRIQNKQSIFTTDQGINYLLEQKKKEKPKVETEKSFFSISNAEAQGLLEDYFVNALGRRPTQDEVKQFTSTVRKRAERKPQVVQKTTGVDGLNRETRVIDPGFGVAETNMTARRQAEAGPEFETYRLATSYYPALLRALGSPTTIAEAPGQ